MSKTQMSRFKSILVNISLVMGSLLFVLIVLEIVFRLLNFAPTVNGSYHKRYCQVNAAGRRDHGYGYDKKEGVFRIVAAGDSFTWGNGIKKIDDIFLMKLEKRLNASSDRKYEVVNGAQGGWDTVKEYNYLRTEGVKFHPDLFIVVYFFNDATKMATGEILTKKIYGPHFFGENLLDYSCMYRFIKFKFRSKTLTDETLQQYRNAYFDSKEKEDLWKKCKEAILQTKKLAEDNHAELLFVIFPVLYCLDSPYCLQDIHDLIYDYLKENRIQTFSLLPAFMAYKGPMESLWASIFDSHPSVLAHQIAADALYDYLKGSGLLRENVR